MATIDILNHSYVPDDELRRIAECAVLPEGRILILAGSNELVGDNLGETVPRKVLSCAVGSGLRRRAIRDREWDVGIVLSEKCCAYFDTHPGYFAVIVGHELGHAALALTDTPTHTHAAFIYQYRFVARDGTFTPCHELPHEKRFEQYGVAVAEASFGRDVLVRDIEALLSDPDRHDHAALRALLGLEGRQDTTGLRDELRLFCMPQDVYYRQRWHDNHARRRTAGAPSLGDMTPPIDVLFDT